MRRPACLALIAAVVAACAGQLAPSSAPPEEPSGWSPLPAAPLAPRRGALAFWTGREVLVLGGTDAPGCGPNADCAAPAETPFADGAAFDPATAAWRRIADAPAPIGQVTGGVARDSLFLLLPDGLLEYHLAADTWDRHPPPPGDPTLMRLVAIGDDLLAQYTTQELGVVPDALFDTATGTWGQVPVDPLADAYDRSAVWTGREVVLLGTPIVARAPDEPPLTAAAVLDPATMAWRRLPDSTITGGAPGWAVVAGNVVNASIGSADGGEVNNWGRAYPFGGILGPAGVWSDLPDPPARPGGFTGVTTGGGDYAIADGWALHIPTGRWTEIGAPNPAASDAAVVWTGDRLFAWGGVVPDGDGSTIVGDGMVWRP